MRESDVSIVTYEPDIARLRQLLASLAEPAQARLNLFIHDNSARPDAVEALRAELEAHGCFAQVDIRHAAHNVGVSSNRVFARLAAWRAPTRAWLTRRGRS